MSMDEKNRMAVREEIVLQKFEGDPVPENEIERVTIVDGRIVAIEKREGRRVIERQEF